MIYIYLTQGTHMSKIKTGACNICGTLNTEYLRCNCANKTLLDLSPITPEDREESFELTGEYLSDTKIALMKLRPIQIEKGGSTSYYDLPPNPTTLQDLIEYRNMNGSIKDIFKACYRLGQKDGMSDIDDVTKMAYYSLRELGRLKGTKDYLALASAIIGNQNKPNNKES